MAAKVDSNSFLQIPVTSRSSLKKVLESKNMKFEKGKAFYEMTKSETIQVSKKLSSSLLVLIYSQQIKRPAGVVL
jgi:hypothetical protein